jgi:hypothetical protein
VYTNTNHKDIKNSFPSLQTVKQKQNKNKKQKTNKTKTKTKKR